MTTKQKAQKFVLIDKYQFLKPKTEFFPIGDGKTGLFFKELGGHALLEYKEYIEALTKKEGGEAELQQYQAMELMAKFVVLSACDESGKNVFDNNDIPALIEKDPALLLDMANFAMPLSGLSSEALGK